MQSSRCLKLFRRMALLDLELSKLQTACSGGRAEAATRYEDALRAVYDLQLNRHHHVQPYRSRKDGSLKWANIDMWPMPVGCHSAPCFDCMIILNCLPQSWCM